MMTISLPIPKKKKAEDFFFLPYDIKQGYINNSYKIPVGGSDNLRTIRTILNETYGLKTGSYVVAAVFNNNFVKLHTTSANAEDVAAEQGATLMYEIDPSLRPTLPDQARRQDSMYNVSDEVTYLQLNQGIWQKQINNRIANFTKTLLLPRLLWVRTDFTMVDLHKYVFKHLRYCFSEWIEWTDPETTRAPKPCNFDLRQMVQFPYTAEDGSRLTRA